MKEYLITFSYSYYTWNQTLLLSKFLNLLTSFFRSEAAQINVQCVILECDAGALRSLFIQLAQCGIHFPTCRNLYEPGRRCVDAERERLMERVGWGEPGHRWRQEADVPAELLGEVPANFETVTEVLWANGLPLNGWWDLRKQMLKNASDSAEMSLEVQQCGESGSPPENLGKSF